MFLLDLRADKTGVKGMPETLEFLRQCIQRLIERRIMSIMRETSKCTSYALHTLRAVGGTVEPRYREVPYV